MFFQALYDNPFLQMALWAALLASLASGIIGSFIVVKRIVFLGGGISHSILGGMGLCLWLQRTYQLSWADPLWGAFGASLLSAWLIGWIHLSFRQREDSVIAIIWSTGMALGVIFVSLTPGTNVELMNFLFGNILWTGLNDLYLLLFLDFTILTLVSLHYRKLLALCFDENQARLQGVCVKKFYSLLLSLVAFSVVLLTQVIGTVLVLPLLTIPAAIASLFHSRFFPLMVTSTLLTMIFCTAGLGVSYECNWPPGATIALVAAAAYLVALLIKKRIATHSH